MDTLLFNTRDELLRVSLKHVVYFESDGNYTNIFFSNGSKATLLYSLSNMELQINEKLTGMPQPFIRIGRQYIVNSSYNEHVNFCILRVESLILHYKSSPLIVPLLTSQRTKGPLNLKTL